MKRKRKKLSVTQRQVTIGSGRKTDKSKCCKAEIRQRRVYPFAICCRECNKDIVYEDQVAFVQ